MNTRMLCAFALALAPIAAFSQDAELKSEKDKTSYAVGVQMGRFMEYGKEMIDLDKVMQGIKDVLEGKTPVMTDEQCAQAFGGFQQAAQSNRDAAITAEGAAYLVANAEKEGVTVLPSGLQYKVVTAGTGPKPTREDTVSTHYRGTFINGEEFDSSYERGQPAQFPVTQVIPGWTEALLLMNVGSKWELYIPSDLAYGADGRDGIPPNSVLLFQIELMEIVKKP